MTVRPYLPSDEAALHAMAARTGFPYPELGPHIEAWLTVCDDEGSPIAAFAAERLVQGYLWLAEMSPLKCAAVIRLLQDAGRDALQAKGYNGCEIFLPPQIEKSFGRRMERTFGWVKNWSSWTKYW